jgi:3-hydroxy-D-aspartate aldolase
MQECVGPSAARHSSTRDEHGVIEDRRGVLRINEKLKLVPGHCDPTCNVHDWYIGVRNGKVEMVWPVSARGKFY